VTRTERALQVWQVLIGAAHHRQTMTYGQLADRVGLAGAGVLAQFLGVVMSYCAANGLPPLTCLVVNQETGLPGSGLTTLEDLPRDREAVYRHAWHAMRPLHTGDLDPYRH
jgi:alkylated DNA nucleotide flippase Atl1